MYYEKRKRELEEQENNAENSDETTAPPALTQSPLDDCEEVIETQLSLRESNKENVCITQQVQIMFDDISVPDRQEADVLTSDDRAAAGGEKVHKVTTREMKRIQLKGPLRSFKKFLRKQAGERSIESAKIRRGDEQVGRL
jgi:hypothetical protein